MDADEFRKRGAEIINLIADYMENIKERRVTPDVAPGYLRHLVPMEPPQKPDKWDDIMKDVENKIMPGITHWQHPRFHAYFPAGNSYSSILGELFANSLGIQGFSWATSPACTELETIVMQWLGEMSNLPESLLPFERETLDINMNSPSVPCSNLNQQRASFSHLSHMQSGASAHSASEPNISSAEHQQLRPHRIHCGGGVLLGSASECVLVSVLSARTKAISKYKREKGSEENGIILTKLVAYASKMSHSCVEKAAMISLVKLRLLDCDSDFSLRGKTLQRAIDEDLKKGLIPFYVCGTFGTTCCCSFDNMMEIGPICNKYDMYLHVDAAYAGNALICEELREYMQGIEYVDSFSYNPNKWMLVNYDCSCLWVKDKYTLLKALSVDPIYLQYRQMEKAIDYRNWGISLSRKFKSLKMWFTIRTYGVQGLQNFIRNHVRLAKEFEKLLLADNRFEIVGKVTLGLVCFRLKGADILSKELLYMLNDSGKIHMIPANLNERFVIRFCVCAEKACMDDIEQAYSIISQAADETLSEEATMRRRQSSPLALTPTNQARLAALRGGRIQERNESSDDDEHTVTPKSKFHVGGSTRKKNYFVRTVSNTAAHIMRSVDSLSQISGLQCPNPRPSMLRSSPVVSRSEENLDQEDQGQDNQE